MPTVEKRTSMTPPWQRAAADHLWMPYCQMKMAPLPAAVERTGGVYLELADGRRLIDGLASWWSACHGYNHPHIVDCVQRQLHRMPHVMFGGVQHEPAATLASRLAAILPGDLNRVFFSDSGSVAVEVAMKMAIQFHRNAGNTAKTRFVAFENAYHGDTTGAMSLCDPKRSMHATFGESLLPQYHRPIPHTSEQVTDLDRFLDENGSDIAAVFIEPIVQGAGGMRFHDAKVLRAIDRCCRRHEVLWVADELATGFGRTGTLFAVQHADVVPDIICLGKALTGGVIGLAATVATESVFDAFWSDSIEHALMHGPTFMANPLACTAANASLDVFEQEPRLEQVESIHTIIRDRLTACEGLPGVVDVRSMGAIGVVQLPGLPDLDGLRSDFVQNDVWLRPFGDCIYLTPPLCISSDELHRLMDAFVAVTQEYSHAHFA